IETTRLSDVITGCGGKLTTCSRMSTLARTASTNGTRKFRPGVSVRWYLPSRSTTYMRCCGTTRTDRITVTSTNSAIPRITIRRMASAMSIPPDHRRDALDLHHVHPLTGLHDLRSVQRARLPVLPV